MHILQNMKSAITKKQGKKQSGAKKWIKKDEKSEFNSFDRLEPNMLFPII